MASCQPAPVVLDVDKAMQAWFPVSIPLAERQPFSEVDLRDISKALHSIGRESWSRIPRIYATLRSINQLPLIDIFLTQGLSDVWFPFSHKTLPESIRGQTARNDFIAAQRLVLNKSLDLEKEDGKHRHFLKQEDIPLIKLAELGHGGFGVVEKVISTVSYKEYARKLLLRGLTFRKNKDVLREFELELAALKRLSHIHIVEFVGSYTDPKNVFPRPDVSEYITDRSRYVGILMNPVAECNLKEYLAGPLSENMNSLLHTSFGCLAAAVNYLHQSEIRHKDIKPTNILIKDHRMLITDFGISRDWSDEERSTTFGPTPMTPKYGAPEVANCQPRNSLSDIWSLGCVFLEMWTVLCEESTTALETHLKSNGSGSMCYHNNIDSVWSWSQILVSTIQHPSLKLPHTWITMMMDTKERRCTAQRLLDVIQESSSVSDARLSFIGQCCNDEDGTAESVVYSDYELEMGEIAPETTTSSATSRGSLNVAKVVPSMELALSSSKQVETHSSSYPLIDLDLIHLSMQEKAESSRSPNEEKIDENDHPASGAGEATQNPSHLMKLSRAPQTPPHIPPQVKIREATLPCQHQSTVENDAVVRSLGSSLLEIPPEPRVPDENAAWPLSPTDNSSFLSVPDFRTPKLALVRSNTSNVISETKISLKVLIDGTQKKFKVEFLSLLHSNIFFDTLRTLLSIPSETLLCVERYSYSAATWIVLQSDDQTRWKAMLRAAKSRLKLRLRATMMSTVTVANDDVPPPSNQVETSGTDQRGLSDDQPILVHIRFRDKVKKVNIPLKRFYDASALLVTLRSELGAFAHEKIVFERYSDSADEYIVLDPKNMQTHKQTMRAARWKGKMRIRAVISGVSNTVENANL